MKVRLSPSILSANFAALGDDIRKVEEAGAQLLHLDDQLGTLEVGKLADVIIVDGDVLSDISKLADPANVKLVLKAGRAAKNTLDVKVPMPTGAV